jgi:hypothetical protein
MTRSGRIVVAVLGMAILTAAAIAAWMRFAGGSANIEGDWKSWRSELQVAHGDRGYAIRVVSPDGFLGGLYAGNPHGRTLTMRGPLSALCGTMAYSKEDDSLEFCGEQFARTGK